MNSFRHKVSLIYAGFILVWALSRWLIQDRFWLFALLNMLAEYYFVPLPFLILMALFRNEKKALLSLAVPLAVFLIFWGQLYLPKFPRAWTASHPALRAMTYNVLVTNRNPQQIIDVVVEAAPDIIGFQELSRHNIPPLDAGLLAAYPYNTFAEFTGARSDVGLVSRYPILSVERFSFPPEERAMHAVINWNGRRVHVFIVHFTANNLLQQTLAGAPALATERFGQRAYQVQRLREEITGLDEPILVLCDCNMLDTSATYTAMSEMFTDSFKESGWGSGHTSISSFIPIPYQRVDYIWHSAEFLSTHTVVGNNQSSDHHPVISHLMLRP
ncbi:MAG: endonuclease/exonuclease/phosphatase family protein [Anaerolineales bacterium]|nr:endonuclease/exonuclease/phosphatase family protein [Anaerolineales bacterium]